MGLNTGGKTVMTTAIGTRTKKTKMEMQQNTGENVM